MAPDSRSVAVSRFGIERKSWPELMNHVRGWRAHTQQQFKAENSSIQFADPGTLLSLGPPNDTSAHNTVLSCALPDRVTVTGAERVTVEGTEPQTVTDLYWDTLVQEQHLSPSQRLSSAQQLLLERRRTPHTTGVNGYEYCAQSGTLICNSAHSLLTYTPTGTVLSEHEDSPMDAKICPQHPSLCAFVMDRDIHIRWHSSDQTRTLRATHYNSPCESAGSPPFVIQEEFDRFTGFWWAPDKHTPDQKRSSLDSSSVQVQLLYEVIDECEVTLVDLNPTGSVQSSTHCDNMMRYPLAGTHNATQELCLLTITMHTDHNGKLDIFRCESSHLVQSLRSVFPWFEYLVRAGWMPNDCAQQAALTQPCAWVQLMSRDQCRSAVVLLECTAFTEGSVPSNQHIAPSVPVSECAVSVHVLIDEQRTQWPHLAHELLTFLPTNTESQPVNDETSCLSVLWLDELSNEGYPHLVRLQLQRQPTNSLQQAADMHPVTQAWLVANRLSITSGHWSVLTHIAPVVDYKRDVLYFTGLKDDPLEAHVYMANLRSGRGSESVTRLTDLGAHYRLAVHEKEAAICTEYGLVAWCSSLTRAPQLRVLVFQWDAQGLPKGTQHLYTLHTAAMPLPLMQGSVSAGNLPITHIQDINIDAPGHDAAKRSRLCMLDESGDCASTSSTECLSNELLSAPVAEVHECIVDGVLYYAMVMRPHTHRPGMAHPVLLHVYAGPEVQLVNKAWPTTRHRKLLSLGYVVVAIDGPGTANRGRQHEHMIRNKMGLCEVDVQVSCVQQLARRTHPLMDLHRVAVFGFSYGGYISLRAIMQRPDFFKVAIAGSAVTSWHLYDTAYTERYLGLPRMNREGYSAASIVDNAIQLPDHDDRVLLLHGVVDENVHVAHTLNLINRLLRLGKPYNLQLYPRERHGVRNAAAHDHMECTMLALLQRHFC